MPGNINYGITAPVHVAANQGTGKQSDLDNLNRSLPNCRDIHSRFIQSSRNNAVSYKILGIDDI